MLRRSDKFAISLADDDLAAVSTWADEIKNQRRETYFWHFVDIPWNASGFGVARLYRSAGYAFR